MEYRKLISFGKSSYVVSLPKSWVMRSKLKKGDLIYFEENEGNITFSSSNNLENQKEKETTILIDGKSPRRIQREIISAYIKDYKSIVLMGEELKQKAKSIQETIHNLVALEVMEETSKKIVARDFLDMDTISVFNLIRKIDIIIRAMIDDCEKMFIEDTYENIFHRDNDVNRLSFLIFRVIEFGLNNPSFMYKKQGLSPTQLLHLWWFTFNLEAVADEVKRVARYMQRVDLDKKQQEQFLHLFAEAEQGYLTILKGFHQQDQNPAHAVLELKEKIIRKCDDFYLANRRTENVGLLIEKLKAMITLMHNLGRVVYQYTFTPK